MCPLVYKSQYIETNVDLSRENPFLESTHIMCIVVVAVSFDRIIIIQRNNNHNIYLKNKSLTRIRIINNNNKNTHVKHQTKDI